MPSSLNLQQFIALKKEDIGQSIEDYFKKTNEAAGLSTEEKRRELEMSQLQAILA